MCSSVQIRASARIHAGLLNESGYLGRIDGGIGFALEEPAWEVRVSLGSGRAPTGLLPDDYLQSIRECLHVSREQLGVDCDIEIRRSVPPHVGLGGKTSLLMAIGHGAAWLAGRQLGSHEVGLLVQRGTTSGIGVNVFHDGGFIWDAGHRFPAEKASFAPSRYSKAPPPRTISRYKVDWLDVVHLRFAEVGIHSEEEARCFDVHCPVPLEETRELLANYAFRILPGLVERDEALLQEGLRYVQDLGFKKVEWDVQSEETKQFRQFWEKQQRPEALGLSSFGPTLYILTKNANRVRDSIAKFGVTPIHLTTTRIANHGPTIGATADE